MAADPNDPDLYAVATAYRNARIASETDIGVAHKLGHLGKDFII